MKLTLQVLADHGIDEKDIAGAVTDAGADVASGIGLAFPREWCTPHMINRALIEGTGTSTSRSGALINPECKALLDRAKTVVEFLNRSTGSKIELENTVESMSNGKGSKSKLSQPVAQRWTSICKMLMRLLQKWDALLKVYAEKEKPFPLNGKKKELEEVYSIVRALKDVTVYCQTSHEATVEGGMQKMIALLGITLEPNKPLVMLRVPTVIVVEGEGGGAGDDDDDGPAIHTNEKRPHSDLTELGRRTREAMNTAVAKRFLPRYGADLANRVHLFDQAMLLSPTMLPLKYIDNLAASDAGKACGMASPLDIKARIRGEVVDLLTEAVVELRARAAKTATAAQAGVDGQPGAKRAKTSSASATQTQRHPRELGLFDDGGSDDDDDENEQPGLQCDAREEAEGILPTWLQTKFSAAQKGLSAAEYWRVHGSRHPSALRAVAQAVFGCPASAGVIERDFCIADWFMPRKRGSLDPAFLEMCLFLRAQFGFISNDVLAMSEEQAKAAVPTRLRDKAKVDEVNVLSFEAEEKSDDLVEDNDAPWELPISTNSGEQGGAGSASGATIAAAPGS